MVIDMLLDRKSWQDSFHNKDIVWKQEHLRYIYDSASIFGFDYLARAIDGGGEDDIKNALVRYIDEEGYGHIKGLKKFVRSVEWLPKGME